MQFADLPRATVGAARHLIRDTLGCVVAGRTAPSSRIITELLEAYGGTPEATTLVSGTRLPAPMAAHINAHCGNALDADDTVLYKAHIGSAVVPAALAIAELCGRSGADLLAAVAVGYEIAGRIGLSLEALAVGADGRFQFAPVTGYSFIGIGAAVAAGRLLDLDEDQMHHAIGIAAATLLVPAATRFGGALPRPMTKYAMYGSIAEGAVLAATLAQRGFTAERDVFDGEKGLWRTVGSMGCRWGALTDHLGARWIIDQACYKIYPTCRFLSGSLDNFFALTRTHGIAVAEIERIVARVPEAGLAKLKVGNAQVDTLVDAGFSLPFMLGVAAFGGAPGPRWLDAELRDDAEIRAFAGKVSVEIEPRAAAMIADDLTRLGHGARMPCSMVITTVRGKVYSAASEFARGDSEAGFELTQAEHEAKFRAFCEVALDSGRIDAALSLLATLERETSVDRLLDTLVAVSAPRRRATSAAHG